MTCVSSSPSKIPYGGFSPVRLQTGLQPLRPSPGRHELKQQTRIRSPHPGLYAAARPPPYPCSPCGQYGGAYSQDVPVQRPLARQPVLVSGSSVRPGHRLLWPHLRLSIPPAALWIMQPAFALRSALGWVREGPQFTLLVYSLRAVFRTPAD